MRYISHVMPTGKRNHDLATSFGTALLLYVTVCCFMVILPCNALAISGEGLPEQPPSEPIEGLWRVDGNDSIIKISCGQGYFEPYEKLECYGYFISIKKMSWRLVDQPLFSLQHYFHPDQNDHTIRVYVGSEYSGLVKNQAVGSVDIQFSYHNQDKLFYHLQGVRGEQRVTLTRVKNN